MYICSSVTGSLDKRTVADSLNERTVTGSLDKRTVADSLNERTVKCSLNHNK
jgi:hypothetical protein